MTFQSLILGNQSIETEVEKRKILLGAYLVVMYLGIDAFFFVVNLFNPVSSLPSLFLGVIVSLVCLVLIRYKWVNTALFLHLVRANFLAFYFATLDTNPYETGTYIYFIPSCLGALAVFGYEERGKGIGFSLVSVILFLIALFDWSRFTPSDAHFYFVFNFLITLTIGMLILLFFDRMVIASESRILQKNIELEKANAELDRFVYSVSHDLRAPLSSILGLVSIYKFTEKEKEKSEIVDHIQARALKLDEFIREILDYARNSRTEVRHVTVDLRQVFKEVMDNLHFVKGFDRLNASLEVATDYVIQSDPERLKVVFNNLISNAIKYQDNYKDASFLKITIERTGNLVIITFQDNGVGIKAEYFSRIFGMFYRANDAVEGSGLGLYIVKETVESLNGKIEMKSEYARGTAFQVILPQ